MKQRGSSGSLMKLEFAPEALQDLAETKKYISKVLKNRPAAGRITNMIFRHCRLLKTHTDLGMSVEAKTGYPSDLRYVVCEHWLAFYRVQADAVQIVRILDGRTDYIRQLFEYL